MEGNDSTLGISGMVGIRNNAPEEIRKGTGVVCGGFGMGFRRERSIERWDSKTTCSASCEQGCSKRKARLQHNLLS